MRERARDDQDPPQARRASSAPSSSDLTVLAFTCAEEQHLPCSGARLNSALGARRSVLGARCRCSVGRSRGLSRAQNVGQTDEVSTPEETSPDEPESVFLNGVGPLSRQFEIAVSEFVATLNPNSQVEHNVRRAGVESGTSRQIDVLISGSVGPIEVEVAAECKHYRGPIEIGVVDEFIGRLLDYGVKIGVLYVVNGATGPAKKRAAGSASVKIEIETVTTTTFSVPNIYELLNPVPKFGDCANIMCSTGDVSWMTWGQENAPSIEAGACTTCGVWAVKCSDPDCGEIIEVISDEADCPACAHAYELRRDRRHEDVVEICRQ
jgi:hypothetical protein